MTKYVQHKSGQGELWGVQNDFPLYWKVMELHGFETYLLPKSEYVEVSAPEVWEDVTADCFLEHDGISYKSQDWSIDCSLIFIRRIGEHPISSMRWRGLPDYRGYRLRKVQLLYREAGSNPSDVESYKFQWAFLVERRQP